VLSLDLDRNEIVPLRQFRLAAHLADGKGNLVEIVAGYVEVGERPVEAARRECIEEIGVAPAVLIELLSYFPSAGISDEPDHAVSRSRRCCQRAGAGRERVQP
jgi:ADP-ribose pyrophosphatase